jgi:hypothetical protein
MIQRFLSAADSDRALRTFHKLAHHEIRDWAITGGLAIELHSLRLRCQPSVRALNDLDFVVSAFDCIPATLGDDFLFRHIHPLDPPGKTILQLIDPDSALRIDVFSAHGAIMRRATRIALGFGAFQVISLEDLVARAARLTLDIVEGVSVQSKHAIDFLRLAALADAEEVEAAWQDHRKPTHPATFKDASSLLHDLIPGRQECLIAPDYSKDIGEVCPRCMPTAAFHLADPNVVLSLLGYC